MTDIKHSFFKWAIEALAGPLISCAPAKPAQPPAKTSTTGLAGPCNDAQEVEWALSSYVREQCPRGGSITFSEPTTLICNPDRTFSLDRNNARVSCFEKLTCDESDASSQDASSYGRDTLSGLTQYSRCGEVPFNVFAVVPRILCSPDDSMFVTMADCR